LGSLKLDSFLGTLKTTSSTYKTGSLLKFVCKMDASLQDIPIFVLEHKWSSDINLNVEDNLDSETNYSSSSIHNKSKL
jgi:hypothetical protein